MRSEGDTGLISGTDDGPSLTDWLVPWSSVVLLGWKRLELSPLHTGGKGDPEK